MMNKFAPILKVLLKDYEGGPLEQHQRREIMIIVGAVLAFILLLGVFTTEDVVTSFNNTAQKFIKSTVDYNPEEAVKYTTGGARELVLSQAKKIAAAKAEGFQTEIITVESKILSQRKAFLTAEVTVDTKEKWPNKEAERFTHVFVMEGQRVGSDWKISQLLEIEAKKSE
ncbi:hypothetical protein EV210_12331 [Anaerospora hongkongensis]|uniref:Mce-associated membrane protein n=1 Tax=Anaerospora hongkongensis TaxID=244830 RepID=A0A4R1PVS4_9FIRM|nr:hypothetical protein [Anaerospora hongkongensis]TCL32211.1 hypothetical protein EV210_12331 [Anaerospora hongkongensis]